MVSSASATSEAQPGIAFAPRNLRPQNGTARSPLETVGRPTAKRRAWGVPGGFIPNHARPSGMAAVTRPPGEMAGLKPMSGRTVALSRLVRRSAGPDRAGPGRDALACIPLPWSPHVWAEYARDWQTLPTPCIIASSTGRIGAGSRPRLPRCRDAYTPTEPRGASPMPSVV